MEQASSWCGDDRQHNNNPKIFHISILLVSCASGHESQMHVLCVRARACVGIINYVNYSCCLFQVESVSPGMGIQVHFMRKSGSNYVWPNLIDSAFVLYTEVVRILPPPCIDGRNRHFF